ncbi:LAQU0S10e02520g1_1 [Lachancea quebecensis]|uniref:LAQU0S10e02520g1_1 n=1 Tax=Lachancea quebecensis TaxID=1654605 RepID=A0A0P1KUK3_9SACH|nr:LAQU0S10e02520g1_1 [Lachancea quebecensis]
MSDILLFAFLSGSFLVAFKASDRVLWYKVQHIFDLDSSASKVGGLDLNLLGGQRDSFLSKFHSQFALSSKKAMRGVRVLFSSTFALCLIAMEMTLCQIVVVNDEVSTQSSLVRISWLITSVGLALNLILIQPYLILLSILDKFYGDKIKVDYLALVASGLILGWVFTLSFFEWGPFFYSTNMLTKLSIMGVSVMAFLSGVASVSTPYYVFQLIRYKRRKPNSGFSERIPVAWMDDVVLKEQKGECERRIKEGMNALKSINSQPNGPNLVLRQRHIEETAKFQLELARLESRTKESKHVRDLKKYFQLGFLVYCVYKLLNTFFWKIPALAWHFFQYPFDHSYERLGFSEAGSGSSDPLAVTLANVLSFLLFKFKNQQDKDSLAKQISLVLSVSLFACSVSTVTTTISYLTTLLPTRLQILALKTMQRDSSASVLPTSSKPQNEYKKSPSVIKNLLVSELTGVYILATILMIRSNLPLDVASRLNQMLGEDFGVPDIVIEVWFDKVFAVSTILSFVGIKVVEKTDIDQHNRTL